MGKPETPQFWCYGEPVFQCFLLYLFRKLTVAVSWLALSYHTNKQEGIDKH